MTSPNFGFLVEIANVRYVYRNLFREAQKILCMYSIISFGRVKGKLSILNMFLNCEQSACSFFESKHFIYSVRNAHSRETKQHYLNIVM